MVLDQDQVRFDFRTVADGARVMEVGKPQAGLCREETEGELGGAERRSRSVESTPQTSFL